MAKMSAAQIKHKVNESCVSILKLVGYKTSEEFSDRGLWNHFFLLIASFAMFILSIVSLAYDVGLLLFSFHSISLFYKLVVVRFQAKALQRKEDRKKTSAKKKVHSPYHLQSVVLGAMLFFLALIMILTLCKVITYEAFFIIAVFFSIVMTLVKELLDGLVLLYNAEAIVKK